MILAGSVISRGLKYWVLHEVKVSLGLRDFRVTSSWGRSLELLVSRERMER